MAPANRQYTLVGFTEDLDWTPLQFENPLPRNRLCSLCGLVRNITANIPCGHVACCSCYKQCSAADGYACPIDDEKCLDEDVDWIDFPAANLLKRKVKCWNQRHGCSLIMAASEVHKHFHRECEYHCTSCPRCSAMVLCRDMAEHLQASCHALTAQQATEREEQLRDSVEKERSTVVRSVAQEQAGEIKALIERALKDNGALNDSLTEVCQSVNVLKESVKQEIASEVSKQASVVCQSVNSLKDTVSQGMAPVEQINEMTHLVLDGINTLRGAFESEMADIKKQNAEELLRVRAAIESLKVDAGASEKTILQIQQKALAYVEELPLVRAAIESVKEDAGASTKTILKIQKKALAYAEKNQTRCDFIVPGIESLEAKALKDGKSEYVHGQVYLRGYNMSPGVILEKSGENVLLNMRLELNKGDHDEDIPWPFEHRIRFSILHPSKNQEKAVIHKSDRSGPAYQQENLSTHIAWVISFVLGDLKTSGYIRNDMLRITWELL